MRTLHSLLIFAYLVLPVAGLAVALLLGRRRRDFKPLAAFLLSLLSAALLSVAICLIYARATDSRTTFGQIALLTYLFTGVLTLLKGFSWLLKVGSDRLFFVHARGPASGPRGVGWALRLAGATLTRVVLLFALGLPYIMSLGMVYRPKVIGGETPMQQLRAPYTDIRFESVDGISLAGWWIPAQPKRPGTASATRPAAEQAASPDKPPDIDDWGRKTVVLCHGLGASKANQLLLVRDLVANGYNVLAFDFRAHGESGGQLCSFGDRERFDVLGAVRWIRQNRKAESQKIVGLGISMGGAALLAAAAEPTDEAHAIDAVAVFSTYDHLGKLADDITANYLVQPVGYLARHIGIPLASAHVGADLDDFSPARAAEGLSPRPLMVVHGRGDHLIPFETGLRLFERAPLPKVRLWVGELNGENAYVIRTNAKYRIDEDGNRHFQPPSGPPADHDNLMYYDDALKAVRLFFDEAMPMI